MNIRPLVSEGAVYLATWQWHAWVSFVSTDVDEGTAAGEVIRKIAIVYLRTSKAICICKIRPRRPELHWP
jgi:hypothetical protein